MSKPTAEQIAKYRAAREAGRLEANAKARAKYAAALEEAHAAALEGRNPVRVRSAVTKAAKRTMKQMADDAALAAADRRAKEKENAAAVKLDDKAKRHAAAVVHKILQAARRNQPWHDPDPVVRAAYRAKWEKAAQKAGRKAYRAMTGGRRVRRAVTLKALRAERVAERERTKPEREAAAKERQRVRAAQWAKDHPEAHKKWLAAHPNYTRDYHYGFRVMSPKR